MMDFIIVSLPRSGSTWATNWLTTSETYCAHDPIYTSHPDDLDRDITAAAKGRKAGMACTGTGWLWPHWVNAHPAKTLILRRPLIEVQPSLQTIGWPELPNEAEARLETVHGWHVPYTDLFDPAQAAKIWQWLTGLPFDSARHAQLVQMRIEPRLDRVISDPAVERRIIEGCR